ncbi:MAG: MlaE family lipid ABC transporter permease subunit [Myxococcales bacterium]|nr:MAG: MlaE family lipid ABC transporter permease subunit [Myxococcales bacterium]
MASTLAGVARLVTDTEALNRPSLAFDERLSLVAGMLQRFSWQSADATGGVLRIQLGGNIAIDDAAALWKRISETLAEGLDGVKAVELDLSAVSLIDGACMALLTQLRSELRARGIACEFVGGSGDVRRIVDLYGGRKKTRQKRARRQPLNAVEQVGNATLAVIAEVKQILDFIGQLAVSTAQVIRHPKRLNLRDVTLTMERAGADAAPIVLLINFLMGFVMAYQSSAQLKQFGANIYVADLVGVSMTRELGPLMMAIIICGRSGAAFAAELGTMKVSEEVDALRTLGFLPLPFLVIPRMLGLILVAPVLVLLADAIGILGGALVAMLTLDIGPTTFVIQLQSAVKTSDVVSGVVKGMVFCGTIALVACQQGLATSGGAEGVGRRTTSAVVSILFALIVLDAVFTVILGAFGL